MASSLLFVGCDEEKTQPIETTQLSTPQAPSITVTDNKVFASTKEVENASLYQFSINGVYVTTPNSYIDLTNYILLVDDYSIKVTAIGSGNFTNSNTSLETVYTVTGKLETPVLSLVDKSLVWTEIKNATSYDVYFQNKKILNTQKQNFDISELVENVGTYSFYVQALGNKFYADSEISNTQTIKTTSQLANITGLSYAKVNNNYLLGWNKVENANYYEIYIDNEKVNTTNSNNFDINQNLTQIKK